VIQTAVPRNTDKKVLVLANGAYGKRINKICETMGVPFDNLTGSEREPISKDWVRRRMEGTGKNKDMYCLVCIVHCETSSGVINEVSSVAELFPDVNFFVDAMSSFGAVPIDLKDADFVVSSANKCLEGVPGFGYALCRKSKLERCRGNSRSLSLDLYEQKEGLDKNGQFRFTPPTHTMLAFRKALEEFKEQGGVRGRRDRYLSNRAILREGMAEMGFRELVPLDKSGYIITSYLNPADPNFDFVKFYTKLAERDQVIYPGKVTDADTFRIGNIGAVDNDDMMFLLRCIREVAKEMGIAVPVQY